MKIFKIIILTTVLLNGDKVVAQVNISLQSKDSTFLVNPFRDKVNSLKKSVTNKWNKAFVNFTNNDVLLIGAIDFSRQIIDNNAIGTMYNYNYAVLNSNIYKPGFLAGFRVDGLYKEKHKYSFQMTLNSINAGNYYRARTRLEPILGDFTQYKVDNKFITLNTALHYKKSISVNSLKYKFYGIIGPSIDFRISQTSNDQLANKIKNNLYLNGDIGFEFNNNDYYLLFFHYKHGLNVFQEPIAIQLSGFQLGISIKAKDLF